MHPFHHFRFAVIAALLPGVLPFIVSPTPTASAQENVKVQVVNLMSIEPSQVANAQPKLPQRGGAQGEERGLAREQNFVNVFPNISIGDVTINEESVGQTTAVLTVRLSATTTDQVTVDYMTADDTAVGGVDYTPRSGTLTFAPGQISQTVFVPITGDTLDEPNETFFVFLFNATNANFSDNMAIVTILDNDPDPGTSGEMLISEFRTSGPAGTSDEFVELYNNTDAPLDIRNYNLSFVADNNVTTAVSFATLQGAVATLPARGHF